VDKKLAFVKMSVYELLLELFGRWTDSEHWGSRFLQNGGSHVLEYTIL
jgi:hypothetical protein